jgi:hypothetical protein
MDRTRERGNPPEYLKKPILKIVLELVLLLELDWRSLALTQILKLEPQIPPISQILRKLLGMTTSIFSWQNFRGGR